MPELEAVMLSTDRQTDLVIITAALLGNKHFVLFRILIYLCKLKVNMFHNMKIRNLFICTNLNLIRSSGIDWGSISETQEMSSKQSGLYQNISKLGSVQNTRFQSEPDP